MFRVRRIVFLVLMVALVGASSTGLSRSACGEEIGGEGIDNINEPGNGARDFATRDCVEGNGTCGSIGGGGGWTY